MSRIVAISATADAERVRLSLNYVRSVEAAGLVPMIVPPLVDPSKAADMLRGAGGLLLTGGEDLDPARYGELPHAALGDINPVRDATELALFAECRERHIPVLAVCRGIQLVNVALGGTLVQDLPSQRPSGIGHDQPHDPTARTHDVRIAAGSRLAAATGATVMPVNSYHHQGVDRVAGGLRVTATAPDGVVEAVETEDAGWWVLAVQWHPEDLTTGTEPWDRGIFRAFAAVVGG